MSSLILFYFYFLQREKQHMIALDEVKLCKIMGRGIFSNIYPATYKGNSVMYKDMTTRLRFERSPLKLQLMKKEIISVM